MFEVPLLDPLTLTFVVIIAVVFVLLFIIYTINLSVVRPRSCRVIYYFDTPALGRRHQSFGRVIIIYCLLASFHNFSIYLWKNIIIVLVGILLYMIQFDSYICIFLIFGQLGLCGKNKICIYYLIFISYYDCLSMLC